FQEAEDEFGQAVSLRKQLVDLVANDERPDLKRELEESRFQRATLWARMGHRDPEVEREYRQTLERQKDLTDKFPGRWDYQRDLAGTYNSLGILLWFEGKAAEQYFREAVKIQEELVQKAPLVPGYRWEIARTHNNLGNLLLENKNRAD